MSDARTDCYVYVLFRENGEPFYVGKGRGCRFTQHEQLSRRGKTRRDAIVRKMIAEGHEVPRVKIAEGLTDEQAFTIERAFIAALGRMPGGPLANHLEGGEGSPHDEATKAKLRKAAKERNTPEYRQRMSLVHKGRKHTDESRAKMSAARKGVPASDAQRAALVARFARQSDEQKRAALRARQEGYARDRDRIIEVVRAVHIGSKRSDEARKKMSAWQTGRILPAETRAKMSIARRNPTPEARANMSAGQKGRKHSPETIEKIKEAHRRRREKSASTNAS